MNKKLLLILSILMSLSLLTMSCAKSVAAPNTPAVGVTPGQELTADQLQTALQSIQTITDNTTGSQVAFNFSQGSGYIDTVNNTDGTTTKYYLFRVDGSSTGYYQSVSQDNVLNQLKSALNYNNNGNITFDFDYSASWDSTTDYNSRILTVNVSAPYYTIPQELKTVKIELYSIYGWQ